MLIFSDDWGRHPSSCQHLTGVFGRRHPVWWVNTIGTRPPRLDLATLRRAFEKIKHWSGRPAPGEAPGNPTVLNPRMWPYFRSTGDRRVNRWLLARQLRPVVEGMRRPVVAITTIPIVADLVGVLPVDRWVYYCVDDYEEWPGLDKEALRAMEARLVDRVDAAIAVSDRLLGKLAAMGRRADVLTHGTDLGRWSGGDALGPPARLADFERPLVVFWGVVDRRMDVEMLARLGEDLDRGTIVLVGPESDPDPTLDRVPRLVRVGPVPFDDLPAIAGAASVLIMPYLDLPVTRAMQPLKLKEYLATGKPAVVRDLPATRDWSDALDLVASPSSFSEAVRSRLDGRLAEGQATARERLRGESWAAKAAEFARLAFEPALTPGKRP